MLARTGAGSLFLKEGENVENIMKTVGKGADKRYNSREENVAGKDTM